jgi:hypothetical protein
VANFFRASYEDRWIAGSASRLYKRDLVPGYSRSRVDYLTNAKTGAVTEIVDFVVSVIERLKHEKMSGGQIVDMNEVADASSIGGWIIRAEDGDRAGRAKRGGKTFGNR